MKIESGNLVNVREGLICHGVNCMGVMGSGVALAIRNKYPQVYQQYSQDPIGSNMLGRIGVVPIVPEKLYIVNMYTQVYYGDQTPFRGTCHFDYEAFERCLASLDAYSLTLTQGRRPPHKIHMPYRIGCGLAQGDWSIVEDMLLKFEFTTQHSITLWKIDL